MGRWWVRTTPAGVKEEGRHTSNFSVVLSGGDGHELGCGAVVLQATRWLL